MPRNNAFSVLSVLIGITLFASVVIQCNTGPFEPAATTPETATLVTTPSAIPSPTGAESAASFEPAGLDKLPDLSGQTLDILTWDGYVPEELAAPFEAATGATIHVTYIESNTELTDKLEHQDQGWDIAQPTLAYVAAAQEVHGLYQPIQSKQIANLDKLITPLNRGVIKYATLGGLQYALPFTWGVAGIIVNTAKVDEPITSYRQFCDPKYAGRVTYRSSFPGFIMMAYAQGYDLYAATNNIDEYRQIMKSTLDYMIECAPNVRTYWETREESMDLIRNEEVYLAEGWDGTGWLLSESKPDIKFIVPEEGGIGWIDTFAIPAQADNPDAAYAWINYLYEPKNAGKLAELSGYNSVIDGALDYLPDKRAALISESLPPEAIERARWSPSLLPPFEAVNKEMTERLWKAVEKE